RAVGEHALRRVLHVVLRYRHALVVMRQHHHLTPGEVAGAAQLLGLARGVRPAHARLGRVVALRSGEPGGQQDDEGDDQGAQLVAKVHLSSWLSSPALLVASSIASIRANLSLCRSRVLTPAMAVPPAEETSSLSSLAWRVSSRRAVASSTCLARSRDRTSVV